MSDFLEQHSDFGLLSNAFILILKHVKHLLNLVQEGQCLLLLVVKGIAIPFSMHNASAGVILPTILELGHESNLVFAKSIAHQLDLPGIGLEV